MTCLTRENPWRRALAALFLSLALSLAACAATPKETGPTPPPPADNATNRTKEDPAMVVPHAETTPQPAVPPPATPAATPAQAPAPAPAPAPVPDETALGREMTREIFSKARNKQTRYVAYVPIQAKADERFPVLLLLHGAYDGYRAWPDHCSHTLRAQSERLRLLIVTPDGEPFGWWADSAEKAGTRIETYLFDELLPDLAAQFPTNERRAIAGLSMGGHGALSLALRRPGFFVSASSMSGILDLTRHTKSWGLDKVFGPYAGKNRRAWTEHSAAHLLDARTRQAPRPPLPRLLATVSVGDALALSDNRAFRDRYQALSVDLDYREAPGGHDWAYWTSQLPEHLAFHAALLHQRAD